ncbi:MAG: methyltransferase domain-containing protein [Ktedonobacterales bacterium]
MSAEPDIVLSHYQTKPLLAARRAGQSSVAISPDLGLTSVEVALERDEVVLPGGERVSWEDVARISETTNQCFAVEDGGVRSIQMFSETTNWLRSLMATPGAPTMLVAGFPMHRIKDTDPWQDTLAKVAAAAPITGHVLDTATGLGYTAIAAARTATHVTTIELDPTGLEIARLNPWSRDLFDSSKITQIVGDAFERIHDFADGTFTRVLHDPPTFSLAGELYSAEFYRQVYRVLARNGRFFHYIGDPESNVGRRVTTGVLRRMQEAGFRRVMRHPEAFGVVATK